MWLVVVVVILLFLLLVSKAIIVNIIVGVITTKVVVVVIIIIRWEVSKKNRLKITISILKKKFRKFSKNCYIFPKNITVILDIADVFPKNL